MVTDETERNVKRNRNVIFKNLLKVLLDKIYIC